MLMLELFFSFFQIGLFSIGGGYAALSLIEEQIVTQHAWLTMTEFADVVTISQMTPGPIAINAATFVGTSLGGIIGAMIATLGCVLAPCIIVLVFAALYCKYSSLRIAEGILGSLRPAVVGLIAAAGVSMISHILVGAGNGGIVLESIDDVALVLIIMGVMVLRIWKVNPLWVMFGAGALGGVIYTLLG